MLLALFLLAALALPAQQLTADPTVIDGDPPNIRVSGLKPRESFTIHSYRSTRYFQPGVRGEGEPVSAHAYARFTASSQGTLNIDTAAPLAGATYSGIDPLGLLWSGEKAPPRTDLQDRQVLLELERDGKIVSSFRVQLTDARDLVDTREVHSGYVNGVFGRPKSATGKLPALLVLHGSEGGSMEGARARVIRFARLGYAVLALNYFGWGDSRMREGLMNIPVEIVSEARDWLLQQPDVDARQLAVYGGSKGAELALLAASEYSWIDRVVACVSSSVVWAGFGRAVKPGEDPSSWTLNGRPLPYIPYDNYDEALQGRISAGAVHRRSLTKASADLRQASRIPIEKSTARILLLGATRDTVWPSGSMTRDIEQTMKKAGKSTQLETLVFENASHFICGTGPEIRKINPHLNPEGDHPLPEADGRASGEGWRRTREFLKRE